MDNFFSWEQELAQQQEESQKFEHQQKIVLFCRKYPNVPFENLQNLQDLKGRCVFTNDASEHYMDRTTRQVYSWHNRDKKWYQPSPTSQQHIIEIFV